MPAYNNLMASGQGQAKEKRGRGRKDRYNKLEVEVGRTSKLVEAGACEVFDQMCIAMDNEDRNNNKKGRKSKVQVIDQNHTAGPLCQGSDG